MRLEIIGSGSKGNCYLLHNDEECLMLEAGVPTKEALKVINWSTSKVKGCLVTHEHKDHSKFVKDILDYAVDVYATAGTCQAMESWSKSKVGKVIPIKGLLKLGNFQIKAFNTIHDAADPCGFLIKHPEIGVMLFATDTQYVPCRFKGLTNILIECNYADDLLAARTDIPGTLKARIQESHMSVDTCGNMLKCMDLSEVNNIVLIHISEGDGNPEAFRTQIAELTHKNVIAAASGMSLDFNKTPF